jgi:hypothetical protein
MQNKWEESRCDFIEVTNRVISERTVEKQRKKIMTGDETGTCRIKSLQVFPLRHSVR